MNKLDEFIYKNWEKLGILVLILFGIWVLWRSVLEALIQAR